MEDFLYSRKSSIDNKFIRNSLQGSCIDDDIIQSIKKLSKEELSNCSKVEMSCVLKKLSIFSRDIRCASCVHKVQEKFVKGEHSDFFFSLFEMYNESYTLKSAWTKSYDTVGKIFHTFNHKSFFSCKGKSKQRKQRCHLHRVKSPLDKNVDYKQIWCDIPASLRKRVSVFPISDLKDTVSTYVNQLGFCKDCAGNVLKALDILLSDEKSDEVCEHCFNPLQMITTKQYTKIILQEEEEATTDSDEISIDSSICDLDTRSEDDEICLRNGHDSEEDNCECEYGSELSSDDESEEFKYESGAESSDDESMYHDHSFKPICESCDIESISPKKQRPTHIKCNVRKVIALINLCLKADRENEIARLKGEGHERHASNVKVGQQELLICIGKILKNRIKEYWVLNMEARQTELISFWLILESLRDNISDIVHKKYAACNEQELISLFEESNVTENAQKKRNKKKKKKNKRKTTCKTCSKSSTYGSSQFPRSTVRSEITNNYTTTSAYEMKTGQKAAEMMPNASNTATKDLMHSQLSDSSSESELTETELRDATIQLESMMLKCNRDHFRARLRSNFETLCSRGIIIKPIIDS